MNSWTGCAAFPVGRIFLPAGSGLRYRGLYRDRGSHLLAIAALSVEPAGRPESRRHSCPRPGADYVCDLLAYFYSEGLVALEEHAFVDDLSVVVLFLLFNSWRGDWLVSLSIHRREQVWLSASPGQRGNAGLRISDGCPVNGSNWPIDGTQPASREFQ